MNDIDAAVQANTALVFLAKHSLDQTECLQVAGIILNEKGLESLKNTKAFKSLPPKADLS